VVYNTQNYWVFGLCPPCFCTFLSTFAVGSLGKDSQTPGLIVFGFTQHHRATAFVSLRNPNILFKSKIFQGLQHFVVELGLEDLRLL
jgi:hypothetical protein